MLAFTRRVLCCTKCPLPISAPPPPHSKGARAMSSVLCLFRNVRVAALERAPLIPSHVSAIPRRRLLKLIQSPVSATPQFRNVRDALLQLADTRRSSEALAAGEPLRPHQQVACLCSPAAVYGHRGVLRLVTGGGRVRPAR